MSKLRKEKRKNMNELTNKKKSVSDILEQNMKDILLADNVNILDQLNYQYKGDLEWIIDESEAQVMLCNVRCTQNLLEGVKSALKERRSNLIKEQNNENI